MDVVIPVLGPTSIADAALFVTELAVSTLESPEYVGVCSIDSEVNTFVSDVGDCDITVVSPDFPMLVQVSVD